MKNSKLNDLSHHRLEMFEKFKNEVLKWFKEKVSVTEMNKRLRDKGCKTDLANYILIKLKKKRMGAVPEYKWIKRDEALIMAVNEKNAKKTEPKSMVKK